MDHDVETVIAREHRLLDPDVRGDNAAMQTLLHQHFREFGSSGTVWDRQAISSDTTERLVAEDLRAVQLGPDAILLTYTTRRGTATSLRTSIWTRLETLLLRTSSDLRHEHTVNT